MPYRRVGAGVRVTALVIGLVTCLSLAPMAAAATRHTDDATGDVWQVLRDNEGYQVG